MAAPRSTPRDAQVMTAILKDMGVTEYEPRVINQMLEFAYRYVTDTLDDAKVYSTHANKKNIDVEDVKLAVQSRLDHAFTTPPPRDLLMDVARHKNATPLPDIKPYTGPKLPPDRYCLSSANYRLKPMKKPRVQLHPGTPLAQSLVSPRINIQPQVAVSSYSKPTVNVTGSSLSLVTRGVSTPTVTIVTRPSTSSITGPATPIVRLQPAAPLTSVTSHTASPVSTISSLSSLGEPPNKRKRENDS